MKPDKRTGLLGHPHPTWTYPRLVPYSLSPSFILCRCPAAQPQLDASIGPQTSLSCCWRRPPSISLAMACTLHSAVSAARTACRARRHSASKHPREPIPPRLGAKAKGPAHRAKQVPTVHPPDGHARGDQRSHTCQRGPALDSKPSHVPTRRRSHSRGCGLAARKLTVGSSTRRQAFANLCHLLPSIPAAHGAHACVL